MGPFRGQKAVLLPHRVSSLKRSTVGPFAVLFRVLSRKKNMTGDNVLFYNWYLLGVKTISSHTHKAGSRYLLGDIF